MDYIEDIVRLTIDHSDSVDGGEFTVILNNKHGKVSSTCKVTVTMVAPVFTQPLNPEVKFKLGDTADLTCEVTASPKPEVQWFRGEELISDGPRYKTFFKDETASLKVLDTTPGDTDITFTCKATNPAGEATTVTQLLPQGLSPFNLFLLFGSPCSFPSFLLKTLTCNFSIEDTYCPDCKIIGRYGSNLTSTLMNNALNNEFTNVNNNLSDPWELFHFPKEPASFCYKKNLSIIYAALLSPFLPLVAIQTASCCWLSSHIHLIIYSLASMVLIDIIKTCVSPTSASYPHQLIDSYLHHCNAMI